MNENMLRFLMMAVFIALVLIIAAIAGELSSYSLSDPFEVYYPVMEFGNVTQLIGSMPLEEHVSLKGTVSYVEGDYISASGNTYRQFFITDGSNEVKVFCYEATGPADLSVGDEIFVTGKFQKYYDTLEIYADCSSVNVPRK